MPTVRLTSVSLIVSPGEIWHYRRRLPPHELLRAERFATAQLASRFVVAHATLRILLSRCVDVEPLAIEFDVGPYGKPQLAAKHGGGLVRFNLSHSHDRALIGIGAMELGVDIEYAGSAGDGDELAAAVMTATERSQLSGLSPEARSDLFYRLWVAKEACMKETGEGLRRDPRNIQARLSDRMAFAAGDGRIWHLAEVPVAPGYRACCATSEPVDEYIIRDFAHL